MSTDFCDIFGVNEVSNYQMTKQISLADSNIHMRIDISSLFP